MSIKGSEIVSSYVELDEKTRLIRRNLLALSFFSIFISMYGDSSTNLKIWEIRFNNVTSSTINTALAIIVVYKMITFILDVYFLFKKWKFDNPDINEFNLIKDQIVGRYKMSIADYVIDKHGGETETKTSAIRTDKLAGEFNRDILSTLDKKKALFWVLDFSLPVIVSFISLLYFLIH